MRKPATKTDETVVAVEEPVIDGGVCVDLDDLPFGPNNPPEHLTYMGYPYEIVGTDFQGETGMYFYGTCSHAEQKIRLRKGLSYEQAVDTMIHEVLHIIWNFSGLRKKETEERAVGVIATGMMAFLKQNPHIYEWIGSLIYAPEEGEVETTEQ